MNHTKEKKEYKVLARKYRPLNFLDLIGQNTLVQTLTNAISINRIAHAYLLTGVRGVGKTTTARLIAMSLNCEKRKAENFEPCNECESCFSITNDRNIDVIEMDAASKTGVDDIREIIENVKYKPVNSNYKIFIIDEVHMLSKSAFNALLKTLEEPPPHIKFIFATTEVKKIPITIISRCQRFDLKRIGNESLFEHLNSISKKENIKIELDALSLLVRAADGSVRDGLSLLDQAIANNKNVTVENINSMLGLADRAKIFEILETIFSGDAAKSLKLYNEVYNSGADVLMIFDEMLKITHFLTQMKISPTIESDKQIPEMERTIGKKIANKISISQLGIVWQILFKGYQELQLGFNLFQHGEMIIIRLIYLYNGPSPDELIDKFKNNNFTEDKKIIPKNKDANDELVTINKIDDRSEISNHNKPSKTSNIKSYRQLVDLFFQKKESMLHTYLYNNVKLVSFKEGEVIINDDKIKDPHFKRSVAKLVSMWTGRIWQISSSSSNLGKTLHEEDLINQQNEIDLMQNDLEIKAILKNFPGSKIHSITNITETSEEKDDNKKHALKEKK